MRIAVIGGSGHIGSFLVPMLVRAGHQVLNLSRGTSQPYVRDEAWSDVRPIAVDREAEDLDGTFGPRVAALHRRRGRRPHLLHPRIGHRLGGGTPRRDRAPDPLRIDLALRSQPQAADARRRQLAAVR